MNRDRLEQCLRMNTNAFSYFNAGSWMTCFAAHYCDRTGYPTFKTVEEVARHFDVSESDAEYLFRGYDSREEGLERLNNFFNQTPKEETTMMQAASAVSKKLYSRTIRTTFFENGVEVGVGLLVEEADLFTIMTQHPDKVEELNVLFRREVSRLAFWLN